MAQSYSPTIVLIGAGNVAHHLGYRLVEKGHQIVQVFSRKKTKAKKLAQRLNCDYTNDLGKVNPEANLYILAVNDEAIEVVASQLSSILNSKALVVHTSGATPGTVLKPHFTFYGNFYPLQTFSISKAVDFSQIPFCIYANRKKHRGQLESLAQNLSPLVYTIDDQQRAILHVAAVFANNFTNHLFHISHQILEEKNIPFDLLKPLIKETAEKVQHQAPQLMQTGPAIRGDQKTIDQHLNYLLQHPDYQKLYLLLTKSIREER